MHIADLKMLQ